MRWSFLASRRRPDGQRSLKRRDWRALALACCAGIASVAGFAPLQLWWLAPCTLGVLFHLWLRAPRRAPWLGFAFGLGLFLVGVHWIYISLHDHGGMPAILAAIALLLFSAFCALIPAAAGYLLRVLSTGNVALDALLVAPAAWTLLEWVRLWLCTGFPWLAMGYSQVAVSPLSGWIPLGGVYLASLLVALLAGCLVVGWQAAARLGSARAGARALALGWAGLVCALTLGGGMLLKGHRWTVPIGVPTSVTLLQGNIPQDDKFDPAHLGEGLMRYRDLASASTARLIVMPESSVPLLREDVPPDYLESLQDIAVRNHGDMLIGMFDEPKPGEIHNSMFSLGVAPTQVYRKHHLVPFGEFIPFSEWVGPLMNAMLNMPIGTQAAAPLGQGVMHVAGQQVAMDICYEDAFGEEIIDALPAATVLVNVSNDAWFGLAVGPEQHLQMAQARALETERVMLRATNTGVTAFIDADGHVLQRAPKGVVAHLDGMVQGRRGSTPFVRFGNTLALALSIAMLGLAWILARMRR